jgi:hypothetical protein
MTSGSVSIEDVMGRHKDIMYSSRTRYNTDVFPACTT